MRLRGNGTKDWYGQQLQGEVLDTTAYTGIVDYDPTELVITARCGTNLREIGKALSAHNQMLAFDAQTGRFLRFLTGPVNCEVTGAAFTPDGRTLFVNIQHPGESPGERSDPAAPRRFSNWPDFASDGRPRSATVVIRRRDGGVIGTSATGEAARRVCAG